MVIVMMIMTSFDWWLMNNYNILFQNATAMLKAVTMGHTVLHMVVSVSVNLVLVDDHVITVSLAIMDSQALDAQVRIIKINQINQIKKIKKMNKNNRKNIKW